MTLRAFAGVMLATYVAAGCGQENPHMNIDPAASSHVTAAQLPPSNAYRLGVDLQTQGRHVESIAYFRRALEGEGNRVQLHLDLGQALHNGSIEMHERGFAVAQSQQRLAMAREALAMVDVAARLATTPEERAYALFVRGRILLMWGLSTEALEAVLESRRLAPHVEVLRYLEAKCRGALSGSGAPFASRP